MNMPLVLLNRRRRGGSFSPYTLFSSTAIGIWLDPSDLSTMFSDRAGTTPVTTPGTVVGLRLDKSKGLALGAKLVTNGDFSDGTTGWTLGTGWSVSDGSALHSGTSSGNLQQTILTAGKVYKITLSVTGGTVNVLAGPSAGAYGVTGSVSTTLMATGGDILYIQSSVDNVRVDNISVRELAGNHAVAPTDAARPIYGVEPKGGRRNLLTWSEGFDNGVWTKVSATLSSSTLTATAANGTITQSITVPASSSFFVEVTKGTSETLQVNIDGTAAGRVSYNLDTKTVVSSGSNMLSPSIVALDNGNLRLSATVGAVAGIRLGVVIPNSGETVGLVGAQLELGSTATPYQRVTTAYDITESGVATCHYVQYDGSDDGMITNSIDFTATDKMSVFAGVRKLSDAAYPTVIELSSNSDTLDGSFLLSSSRSSTLSDYYFQSRGTLVSATLVTGSIPAPSSNVIVGLGDISGDRATLRVNGTQVFQSTANQGTGNYGNYKLNIGRRGNDQVTPTFPFNGRDYGIVVVGKAASAGEITDTETWLAAKTAQVTI